MHQTRFATDLPIDGYSLLVATAKRTSVEREALRRLRAIGGAFRTGQANALGITAASVYRLRDAGHLEQLSRGVFRPTSLPPASQPDLVVVSTRLPNAVVCLISALALHELTDEIPHEVHVALPRGAEQPRLDQPPLRVVRLRPESFGVGVETRVVDGVDVRVFSAAKTVADCFQFRNQVGLDTALGALRAWMRRREFDQEELLAFAKICRVERLVRNYVEALL